MKITKRQLRRIIREELNRSPLGTDEEIADQLIRMGKYSFKQKRAVIAALRELHPSYKQKMSDISSNIEVGY